MDVNDLKRITDFMEAVMLAAAEHGVDLYGDQKIACSIGPGTFAEIRTAYGEVGEDGARDWHLELLT